jgi:hypothetical protein
MPHGIVPSRHPMCHRLCIGLPVRPSARFWKVRLVEPETAHERSAPTKKAVPELCGALCDQTALGGADRLAAPRSRRAIGRCAPSIALYGVGAWQALVAGYTESGPPLPSMRVPWRTAPLRVGSPLPRLHLELGSNPATSAQHWDRARPCHLHRPVNGSAAAWQVLSQAQTLGQLIGSLRRV